MYVTCPSRFEYFITWYGEHWVLGTIIVLLLVVVANAIIQLPYHMWRSWMRSRTIQRAGWPPEHLTIDGDEQIF